jgi:hypothetical protein
MTQTLDFEWLVEGGLRPIPTLVSKISTINADLDPKWCSPLGRETPY